MDYEKKYKEALERAKEINNEHKAHPFDIMLKVFPELKESEDEKVVAGLVKMVQVAAPSYIRGYGIGKDDVLAWLEKQGETFTKKDVDDAYLKGVCDTKHELEKQGKQKPFDYKNANIQQKDFSPKVEPKFKVGNWYQCTKDFFGKGVTFDKNTAYYCAKEGCLQCEYGCHIAIVKDLYDNFKLWTIQDAKDGDVLSYVTDEGDLWIMIYRSLYEPYEGHVHYHALLVNDNFGDKGTCCICIDDLNPAAKEQCDLLFSKMKEAGYEWDAEKKELIKVPKTKEPEGALKKLLDEQDKFYKEAKIVLEDKDTALAFLRRMGIIDEYGDLAEKYRSDQTPATTISAVNGSFSIEITDGNTSVTSKEVEAQYCTGQYEPDVREFPIEWKQENVDELSEFERAMMHIGGSFFGEKVGLDPNNTNDVKEQAKFLLELAPKQEWSEEDKDFMYETLSNLTELKDRYGEGHGNVGNCIDWLRSIKDKVQSLSQPKEWSEEDERIRKDLIGTVHLAYDCGCSLNKEQRDKYITWLEKQGEDKSPEKVLKIRQEVYQSGYNDGYKHGCEDTKKQGEQKPVELCQDNIPLRDYILNIWELGNYWKNLTNGSISTKHGTQLEYIQNHWKEGAYYDRIKPKCLKQKPVEWSEEDEAHFNDAIYAIQTTYSKQCGLEELIAWLKQLKERIVK